MKTDHAQHLIMAKKQDLDHLDRDLSPVCNLARVCSVRYRYSRYRYGRHTEITEVSGTGIDVVPELTELSGTGIDVPKLPKCPVSV